MIKLKYFIIGLLCVVTADLSSKTALKLIDSSIAEGSVVFYNLTKNITLTFDQDIAIGKVPILLNGDKLPMDDAVINKKSVTVPLKLKSVKDKGVVYNLQIPANAFISACNSEIGNDSHTLKFRTFKKADVPDDYSELIDVVYSDVSPASCRLDFYAPKDAKKPTPIVFIIHGGGWQKGYKEAQVDFSAYTDLRIAIANVNYRLADEAKAPAALEDVRCAIYYMIKNAKKYNIDPERIILYGGSAGAHLALTAGYLQNNRRYDINCSDYEGEIKIVAVLDKSGPTDLWGVRNHNTVVNWVGSRNNDEEFLKSISPIYMVNKNTPATYLIHGNKDKTVPIDMSAELLVPKLKEFNIPYQYTILDGEGHSGFSVQSKERMSREIKAFLIKLLPELGK